MRELWKNDEGKEVKVYRSTQRRGNRSSMNGRDTVYNTWPVVRGITGFGSLARAREHLTTYGYKRVTRAEAARLDEQRAQNVRDTIAAADRKSFA